MCNKSFLSFFYVLTIFSLMVSCTNQSKSPTFQSNFPKQITRTWIGPQYWANRLQDWHIKNGRLECLFAAADRNVHLLTYQLGAHHGEFIMSVRLGIIKADHLGSDQNWLGFRIGAKGQFDDYRDSAIFGKGLDAGITTAGKLFIGEVKSDTSFDDPNVILNEGIELRLIADQNGENYRLHLSAYDAKTGTEISSIQKHNISNEDLAGNIALVCHLFEPTGLNQEPVAWFINWRISGGKIDFHEDHTFGPILFSQYTLSNGILKMTAQLPPISEKDGQTVRLQTHPQNQKNWQTVTEAPIDKLARTATFRIQNWDSAEDQPYRLEYEIYGSDEKMSTYYWEGTVRKEPRDKDEFAVAAFTGNHDLGFPHNELVKNIKTHNPDLLFFSGDQIYENDYGYGIQRAPMDMAALDYLRKWYCYGWAFRDILKERPAISIPDDHDVYHGNLWGAGGKATPPGLQGADAQDAGGYKMPPQWVNMVERTQTSHLPDPYDPLPIEQEIGVYYCEMDYAGISFAIVEDRKFKSAPKMLLPRAQIRNGWPQKENYNAAKESDVPGAKLLGDRQLKFLHEWSVDWKNNTWMKVMLSQTLFSNVATLPGGGKTDAIVPRLPILKADEYPVNDQPVSDHDSNGWPQSGRNRALRHMRRCFALHIAGDQHLGSTIRYGIDDWNDAGFALCVPSISNYWPRRWYPATPGKNQKPGAPRYTGEFKDGFGNKVTVHAVCNPTQTGKEPAILYDRASGYGIVRFNRTTRDITIECWPRWSDPSQSDAKQYPGWPVKINQLDNYGRKAYGYLPKIQVRGMTDPVVQMIDQENDEVVYTLRIRGTSFQPWVFKDGIYRVDVGESGTDRVKVLRDLRPAMMADEAATIEIEL